MGQTEEGDLLLKTGASSSVINKKGFTPLQSAAGKGDKEVVELLLNAGASLSVVDEEGSSPLHDAALFDHTGVAKLLLKVGASPSVVDEEVIKPSVKLRQSNCALLLADLFFYSYESEFL